MDYGTAYSGYDDKIYSEVSENFRETAEFKAPLYSFSNRYTSSGKM